MEGCSELVPATVSSLVAQAPIFFPLLCSGYRIPTLSLLTLILCTWLAQKMTVFDELAETDGDNEFMAWVSKVIDAKQEIVAFVASRRQGKPTGEFDSYLKGSFNLSLVVRFSDGGPKAVIRFPKPGHTAAAFREEKVRNEVQFLEFLSENTTIPVLRVVSWGMVEDSPQHLGPFIITDYVDGISLATI